MKSLLWLSALALMATPFASAQQSSPMVASKTQMVVVAPDVRLIEETTLPVDPSLQASNRPSRNTGAEKLSQDGGDTDNGLKMFRFTLAPGETLITQIKAAESNAITQQIGNLSGPDFTPTSASKAQMSRINRGSRQQRSNKIEYKNLEPRPFPFLLIVYGQAGHPFQIVISRESSK